MDLLGHANQMRIHIISFVIKTKYVITWFINDTKKSNFDSPRAIKDGSWITVHIDLSLVTTKSEFLKYKDLIDSKWLNIGTNLTV